MKTLTVGTTEIYSTQEWTTDPDKVEIYLPESVLALAAECVAFMAQHSDVDMVQLGSVGWELFELDCDGDDAYVVMEPEYTISHAYLKVLHSGLVRAVLPFRHTADEIWCELGLLSDLQAKMEAA